MYLQLHDPAFLAVASGGTPALDLFFSATKALDSRITFTRGSSATFINSSGLVETAASGVARFTHNPSTLASLGLLIEESRTNLLLNSATLSTQNVTVSATAYTLSFTGTGSITRSGTSTGTLTGTGDGEANRVKVTFTPTAGTLTLTVSGTVTNAQLEAGAFATSYIPTTSATVTRAADVATMTGTNFSSWFNATEGTVVADFFSSPRTTTGNEETPISFSNNLRILRGGGSRAIGCRCGSSAFTSSGLTSESTRYKAAMAYGSGNNSFVVNGGSILNPAGSDYGSPTSVDFSTGGGLLNAPISRIRYYRRRLPNANLQTLTT